MDKTRIAHKVWIVTAPFCAMLCIHDVWYLTGNTSFEAEREKKTRESYVAILQRRPLSSSKDSGSFIVHSVQALRNIVFGV